MIDFTLTDEQIALQNMARKFAKNEILPIAAKCDHEAQYPVELIQKAHNVGLLNLSIPVEYGGIGLGILDQCIIMEEIGSACTGIGTIIVASDLGIVPIELAGSDEQKRRFLEPMTKKCSLAAFALTEPGAGSDAASISTTCRKEGDKYILNGTKQFISNARVADLITVFATKDKTLKHRGLCAFVVEKGTPGMTIGKDEDKLGQRAAPTNEITFEECAIPEENLLGNEGDGFKIALNTLDRTRIPIGAMAVGLARSAMEYSIDYASKRVQFKQPIINFQAIQWKIAEMAKNIELARLIVYRAAWSFDRGLNEIKISSMAKAFATDIALQSAIEAVQIFGGYGYTKEYPVEKLMRDAKLLQIYEGTNEIQHLVIAKEVIKERS